MRKIKFSKSVVLLVLVIATLFAFTGCGSDKTEEKNESESTSNEESDTATETEVEQDFIVVGSDNGEPLIFYNLNAVTSVDELEEYVDLSYDFEEKPEILLAQVEAPEGVFEQIKAMLDEKGVVYTIIEDEEQ